jgi:hypothetical protein
MKNGNKKNDRLDVEVAEKKIKGPIIPLIIVTENLEIESSCFSSCEISVTCTSKFSSSRNRKSNFSSLPNKENHKKKI